MTHPSPRTILVACTLGLIAMGTTVVMAASDVGRVKIARGAVTVQRGAQRIPATVGLPVQEGDVVVTGADGSAGIVFADDSLLSVGPNSTLAIDRYAFDATTHKGNFQSSLRKGTLSAISGKLARQSPDAMTVRTPVAIMGVRGTHVLVRAGEVEP